MSRKKTWLLNLSLWRDRVASARSAIYFISDLHLEASRPDLAGAFHDFLRDITPQAQALYILGDLFDQWVGDDDNSRFVTKVKSWLRECSARGVKLFFLHGNRDFLIGERFARESSLELLDEHTVVDLFGEHILLLHGDTLCTQDEAYQAFRRKVRDPEWKHKILRKPLFVRKLYAAYIRFRSRRANRNKTAFIMDVTPSEVHKLYRQYHVKRIIHGHTHRPARHHESVDKIEVERIVLGDWDKLGWYLKVSPGDIQLVDFTIA